jgi:hypothetical protein
MIIKIFLINIFIDKKVSILGNKAYYIRLRDLLLYRY